MRLISRLAAVAFIAILQACTTTTTVYAPGPNPPSEVWAPVTILVSIDGFRPDYLERGVTPNLSKLAAEGISAAMRPSFPSKTFPNHWTLVTGLRPDRHGIVANKFEDPARPKEVFTMASDDPFWWNAADPIWVDAEKAGIRTGTLSWPGSNVPVGGTKAADWPYTITGGTRPSDWAQFNQAITGEQRVRGLIDWMRRPGAIRPKFATIYFDTVDTAGHTYGPDDPRTTEAVADIDKRIGELVAGLDELGQPVNFVIVADHGMAQTSSERVALLTDYVAKDDYRMIESGPFASLVPVEGKEAAVEKALLGKHPHFECWRRSEIPARYHYGSNPRIPPIFCLAEVGWEVKDRAPDKAEIGGTHGYDNDAPEMRALFIANGPAFKPARLATFDNVDVYPLLRDLLGLPPVTGRDGDDAPFRGLLNR